MSCIAHLNLASGNHYDVLAIPSGSEGLSYRLTSQSRTMVYTDLFENHHTFFDGPWNSAWLCFYGFWSAFTTMGPYQAFGLIAGYHTETLDRVQLALVGALSGALPYISGPIIDLVLKCWLEQEQGKRPQDSRFRMVVVKCTYGLCATGVALGYGLATRVRHLEMFVVYQGLMVGVFNGYHVASMTNVIEWLNEDELPLALGVISAGASLGGVVYPLWFFFAYSNKDDVKGTNTTLAILSGLSGLLLAILAPVPRCPPVMIQRPSTKRRPLKDIFPRMLGWRMILCIILCGVCEASASFIPLMYRGDFGNLFSYDALEGVCYQSAVNLVGLWFNIWTGMFAPYLSLRRVLAVSVFASPVVILCFWLSSIMLARKDLWIAYLFSSSVLDGGGY